MEFKKQYSDEEIEEIKKWFKDNEARLPQSLQLDSATYLPNFKKTLSYYIDIVDHLKTKETYAAQIHHLFKMRDAIENLWNDAGNAAQ